MKNKYYTPDISEFHVGFEYEMECLYETDTFPKYEWAEATVEIDEDLKELNRLLNSNEIRVKYLDKEDIEELGWSTIKHLGDLNWSFKIEMYNERIHEDDSYRYWHLYLNYFPDKKRLTIKADVSDGSQGEKFFEGICRNKSELRQIMRMLNITIE